MTTLRSLAANDERIIEEFRAISEGRKVSRRNRIVDIDIPAGMILDTEAFMESIKLKFWSKLAMLSWRPFKDAQKHVRSLGFRGAEDWRKYCSGTLASKQRKPPDIPSAPYLAYEGDGWTDWSDWLGTGVIATDKRKYLPFGKARIFARKLGLRSRSEWLNYCRSKELSKGAKPKNIPTNPWQVYKDNGWNGLGDWLGTGIIATTRRKYRSHRQARSFVRRLGLRTEAEWKRYCKGEFPDKKPKPGDIPANPYQVYLGIGWNGIRDWLGTEKKGPFRGAKQKKALRKRVKRQFLPFRAARKFARSLNLKGKKAWIEYSRGDNAELGKRPSDIPSAPNLAYKGKGWISWGDWLGTGRISHQDIKVLPFEDAREFARSLGLRSMAEWMKYSKGEIENLGKRPQEIPAAPHLAYKNKGWISWGDWLGK